jgi:hypothetical protein
LVVILVVVHISLARSNRDCKMWKPLRSDRRREGCCGRQPRPLDWHKLRLLKPQTPLDARRLLDRLLYPSSERVWSDETNVLMQDLVCLP